MKNTKKIWDSILFILNLIGFCVIYYPLYSFNVLNINAYIIISFVTAVFYTKQQTDRQFLEDKIFELKELIESFKK